MFPLTPGMEMPINLNSKVFLEVKILYPSDYTQ